MSALVSIGLPVYNGERYLAQALDSLLSQSHENLEILIADNASTDASEAICRDFAARDPRIAYHRHPRNLGAAANYNFVFRRARGAYFRWAAHDDICMPRLVERCVAALEAAGPSAVLAYPRTRLIDAEGRVLRDYDDRSRAAGRRRESACASCCWSTRASRSSTSASRSSA
jgi:glycosyltransferase involved in cell wall biosynthesis